MTETLHNLLGQEDPASLPQIERALASQDELSQDQEAVLSALIWRRCTQGSAGLLGSVLQRDCAQRIEEMPTHLEAVGASDAAAATQELVDAIPLDDDRIKAGLVDWIDTQTDVVRKARELGTGLEDIDRAIWEFMKDPTTEIPDLPISTRAQILLAKLRAFFSPGTAETS
ncbi:hypothetical protein [Anianabacter salinae]|uniref:hypothetical protein n=1 Tax=Anianabacter salinae TaxID=2851023 RepID=UPI00225E35BA|nr:hypothetical protein [Anianabacter salinae]MBV0913764.1 hypothetical protein [Anianabacter salinae]